MKSLVVGLGIGNLYVDVLAKLGSTVVTCDLDPAKNADYIHVSKALADGPYDTIHICTPNFTHEQIYFDYVRFRTAYNWNRDTIVFVEKPGFESQENWRRTVALQQSRLLMVKNNQYRSNISVMAAVASTANSIKLHWLNEDRVPHPGSWFTTKKLAYGGVSRDLMPHLLSYLPVFFPQKYSDMLYTFKTEKRWQLSDLTSSDYGSVNTNGTYDVDDYAQVEFDWSTNQVIELVAGWRTLEKSDVSITFNNATKFELGLCPEDAYAAMIETAIKNRDNDVFWDDQLTQDLWIHGIMEKLN